MAFTPFSSKEKRKHYTERAKDTSLTPEQQAYAKGQRDARNDELMGFLLGRNSPLSQEQKSDIKSKRRARAAEYKKQKKANKGAKR